MKKLFKFALPVTLLIILLLSMGVLAKPIEVSDNKAAGSFKVDLPESVDIKNNEYVPIDEVASVLNTNLDWRLEGNKVQGSFGNHSFSSSKFLISNGHLYIPINIFLDNFGIHIEIRGNNYFIYNNYHRYNDLELNINTNKIQYKRNEAIAVSILLLNQSHRTVSLRYSSSQNFDLVLRRYNREVWRLSENRGYLPSISMIELDPDDFILNTALISPGKDTNLYYGTYQLFAEIRTAFGGIMRSNEIQIKIR